MQETRSMADLLPTSPRMDEENRLLLPEALPTEVQAQLDTTRGAAGHVLDAVVSAAQAIPLVKTVVLARETDETAAKAVKSAASAAWGTALKGVGVQTTPEMNPADNLTAAKEQGAAAVKVAGKALNMALNPVAMVRNAVGSAGEALGSATAAVNAAANGNFLGGDATAPQRKAA